LPIERVGPQVIPVFGVDELCRDPEPVARSAYASFDDVCHVELPTDFGNGQIFILESE
jgi:hypothetical protein